MKKKIGISAQNIIEGGPLTILRFFLDDFKKQIKDDCIAYVFLNNKKLIDIKKFNKKNFKFIYLPKSSNNYFYKIYYQIFYFEKLSLKIDFDSWISLQDLMPNVHAKKKISYFHSPIIFHKMSLKEIFFEPSSFLRKIFFEFYFKKKNIKNNVIITQQRWIKNSLIKKFKLNNIIVSNPKISKSKLKRTLSKKKTFIYPSLPRFQKNYEVICKACEILNRKELDYEILFTFNKYECKYSKYISKISSKIPNIKFIGRQNNLEMKKLYQRASYLIFSSKLETWGLPVSEAISYNIPIIISNLAYAKETIGTYKKVIYFNPDNYIQLSNILSKLISGKTTFNYDNHKKNYKNYLDISWNKII